MNSPCNLTKRAVLACVVAAAMIAGCDADSSADPNGDVVVEFDSEALNLENLVAFYPFWDNIDDHSGHQNHGVNHGGTFGRDRFGGIRGTLELDGETAHAVLAQQVVGTELGESTLSLWFKTTQTTAGALFFEGVKGGKGLWIKMQPGKNRILARAKGAFEVQTDEAYNDGRWHHLVLRTEGSSFATLFVDGAEVASVPFHEGFSGAEFLPVTPVLGRVGEPGIGEATEHFSGSLDDLTVFRSALSNEAVGVLFRDGPNRVPTAVVDGPRTLFVPEVTFDASSSWDDDGVVVRWQWNFGDGLPAEEGAVVTHAFPDFGTYTVTVTITDDDGGRATA